MSYLRIYEGDVLSEQRELTAERTTIGRANDNDIVLDNPRVSGHHAVIERDGHAYVVIDNGSANGIFVNGERVARHTLEYWEEIQILNYVLKFMPRAKLPGEQEGALTRPSRRAGNAATMAVDVSGIADLMELRKQKREAFLSPLGAAPGAGPYPLNKGSFTIGRSPDCDIVVAGWLAPGVAARIQRRSDGHYLVPAPRGKVRLNGNAVTEATQLHDGDQLEVRGLALKFALHAA